jgi:nucleotide-binding universal stress UspA family protein
MLAIHTVLHATDFSRNASGAFQLACALAHDYGARLVLLHVTAPPVGMYGDAVCDPEPPNYQEPCHAALQRLQPGDLGIPVDRRVAEGDAPTEILRVAADIKADIIVMGTHGRTGVGRLVRGSVAETVVRSAPCPVLTVKPPLPAVHPSVESHSETVPRASAAN